MTIIENDSSIRIDRLELGPYGTNSYVLTCCKTGAGVVIDAPGEVDRVLSRLQGIRPQYILITHTHMDHVGGLSELTSALNVPVAVHPADAPALPAPPDILLQDGDIISFGELKIEVLHTPGHTPGSVCFLTGRYLIAGDTLFPGGPGHTRSPRDFRQILESITHKLTALPDNTAFYPGHGEAALLGREKKAIEGFSAQPHAPELYGDVLWTIR
jgi:hydroxyacylglutathione hydrolase